MASEFKSYWRCSTEEQHVLWLALLKMKNTFFVAFADIGSSRWQANLIMIGVGQAFVCLLLFCLFADTGNNRRQANFIAIGVAGISLLSNIIGLAIPYWVYDRTSAVSLGLWQSCVSDGGGMVCTSYGFSFGKLFNLIEPNF